MEAEKASAPVNDAAANCQLGKKFQDNGDLQKAKECYQDACDQNYALGCLLLGEIFHELGKKDENVAYWQKGFLLHEKDCVNNKNGNSCFDMGLSYLHGITDVLEKNEERAYGFFTKGCDYGDHNSCFSAGKIDWDNGNEVSGRQFLEKGCEKGGPQSCKAVGIILRQQINSMGLEKYDSFETRNERASLERSSLNAFVKCCESEDPDFECCKAAGSTILMSDRIINDHAEDATRYLAKACILGTEGSVCQFPGNVLYNGLFNIAPNKAEALQLLRKGCDLGDRPCCDSLSDINSRRE